MAHLNNGMGAGAKWYNSGSKEMEEWKRRVNKKKKKRVKNDVTL
jgi:hypothetical protein